MNQQGTVAPSQGAAPPIMLQRQFFIRHESPDGQTYEGTFTCKKLSIKDYAQVNVRKVQLNGGLHHDPKNPGKGIDEDTDWINMMIAHLENALIQVPIWFDLNRVHDMSLMTKVYGEVASFENEVSSPQRRAAISHGGSQADSGATGEQPRAAGSVKALGGGQVQPSLEP